MERVIEGKSYCFGKNIDTDQIYPGQYLELTDHKEIASHCLEGADENFSKNFRKGGIVVALENFGCGSSREHAAIAIKTIGISAVIAKSFGRIFYRNAINMGVPLIVCSDVEKISGNNHILMVDFEKSLVINKETGMKAKFESISDYAMEILECGGIKKLIERSYK